MENSFSQCCVTGIACQWLSSKWAPPPRRDEGACTLRPVTEKQRRRRIIFNSTLRAAVLCVNFRVARSTSSQRIQALRSLLEIRPNSSRPLSSHTCYTTLAFLRKPEGEVSEILH